MHRANPNPNPTPNPTHVTLTLTLPHTHTHTHRLPDQVYSRIVLEVAEVPPEALAPLTVVPLLATLKCTRLAPVVVVPIKYRVCNLGLQPYSMACTRPGAHRLIV